MLAGINECRSIKTFSVMPDLIRHPECLERTGLRLEFIPMKIGAGVTNS